MSEKRFHDRRAFLRGLVRWPALAGLGALGACLATRDGEPLQADEQCINRGLCRGCGVLPTCGLPQARLARGGEDVRPGQPRFRSGWPAALNKQGATDCEPSVAPASSEVPVTPFSRDAKRSAIR